MARSNTERELLIVGRKGQRGLLDAGREDRVHTEGTRPVLLPSWHTWSKR